MDNPITSIPKSTTTVQPSKETGEKLFKTILKENWDYDDFRGIQLDIIESIYTGHDTLGLMPTGGGKSITFQVPALACEGTCIVITPLIALMKDQVSHLRAKGIKAGAIYSGMTHEKVIVTLENCILGDYKLLYISPERISSELFQKKLSHMKVSFICVDEAHCISQWGYDFRPSYLKVKEIRKLVPNAPILALTATATPKVVTDIQQQLLFPEDRVFKMSFERKNLAYKVYKADDKFRKLKKILKEREGSVIIYCRNRQKCKEVAELLQAWGYTATYYHAGLSDAEKDERQRKWAHDAVRIMVATNAFGMGIDKAEVRLVIHISLPDAIESYFQEAGRAGRDGQEAEAILLYNGNDIKTLKNRVKESYPEKEHIRNLYEEICCYLQIAIGFGQGIRKEFNIIDFCRIFHEFPTYVESTLSILTKAGYINYTDKDEPISKVMFTVKRDELYYINESTPIKGKIIQSLLRQYSGLFVKYVPIDEECLAKTAGVTKQEIYNELKSLTKQNILNYIPKKNIPHISFTKDRVEKEEIILRKEIYEERRNNLIEQINSILEYATEDDTCRNKYLINYFGEKVKHECGKCDICEENANIPSIMDQIKTKVHELFGKRIIEKDTKQGEEKRKIKNHILKELEQNGRMHPFTFNLDDFEPDIIKEAMNELVDEELIYTDENMYIYRKKQN